MKITGRCLAHNARAEAFIEQHPFGLSGRRSVPASRRSKLEIHPFAAKRAKAGLRPRFLQRRTTPYLEARIARAHRAKDPFYGLTNFSLILDAITEVPCQLTEAKPYRWAFSGVLNGASVTLITRPMNPAPAGTTTVKAGHLPIDEIYLHSGSAMLACCLSQGVVRLDKNQREITV